MRNPFKRKPDTKSTLTLSPQVRSAIDLGLSFDDSIAVPLFDGHSQTYARIYREQPAVRSVVDFLSRNIAQVGLKVYAHHDDSRMYQPDHPAQTLLNNPAPRVSRSRFFRSFVADLAIYDRALLLKIREGDKIALVRVPLPEVSIKDQTFTAPLKFTIGTGPTSFEVGPESVIYLHGYSPTSNNTGTSPMDTLRQILGEEKAAGDDRQKMWKNGTRAAGYWERQLEAAELVGREAVDRWAEDMAAQATGENAGKSPLAPPGFKFHDTRIDSGSAEYLGTRRLAREEVARAYGIPLPVLGLMDTSNWGVDQFHMMLYQECLAPWCVWIQEEFEQQLLYTTDFEPTGEASGYFLDFNLAEKLNGSPLDQAKLAQQLVGRPTWTADEYRRRVWNLPPLEDGSGAEVFVPTNVVAAGGPQADPTDATNQFSDKAMPYGVTVPWSERKTPGEHTRASYAADHEAVYRRSFARMKAVTMSSGRFKPERWTKELYEDLRPLAAQTVRMAGKIAALNYGEGVFDPAQSVHWLDANTAAHAELVVKRTKEGIDAAEDLGAFFDQQIDQRAPLLADMRATQLVGFATNDAAKQSGHATKTWVVTSANPRPSHAHLDGETVGINESFSNGADYPCAPGLDVEETAGCSCLISYGSAQAD